MAGLKDKIEKVAQELLQEKYGLDASSSPQESIEKVMGDAELKDKLEKSLKKMVGEEREKNRVLEEGREYSDKVENARGRMQDDGQDPNDFFKYLAIEFEDIDPDDIETMKEMLRAQLAYRQQEEAEAARVAEETMAMALQDAIASEKREASATTFLQRSSPTPRPTPTPSLTPSIIAKSAMNSFEYSAAISSIKNGLQDIVDDMKKRGVFPKGATVTFDANNKNFKNSPTITIQEPGAAGNMIETIIADSYSKDVTTGKGIGTAALSAKEILATPRPSPSGATIQPGQTQSAQQQPAQPTTPGSLALEVFARSHGQSTTFAPLVMEACGAALAGKLKGVFEAVGLGGNLTLNPKDGVSDLSPRRPSTAINLDVPKLVPKSPLGGSE